MKITLTPEQEELIQHAIDSGRLKSAEEAVQEALSLWEERQRDLTELLAALDEAEEDFRTGNFIECDSEGLPDLAEEIKRKVRESLGASAK